MTQSELLELKSRMEEQDKKTKEVLDRAIKLSERFKERDNEKPLYVPDNPKLVFTLSGIITLIIILILF